MENNATIKSNRNKTILLDSDYRGGAILYTFTASILLAYAIINSILWTEVTKKPTQAVSKGGATSLAIISAIISLFAGIVFIYSIYKIITAQEQRDKIAKSFYNWANQPSGIKKLQNDKIDLADLNKRGIEEPRGRDIFANVNLNNIESAEPNSINDPSFIPVQRELNLSGF